MIDASTPPWPARPALFLDLDGTLLEIAEEPGGVVLTQRLNALLERLPPATDGALAFISGRPLAEVDDLLAPRRFAAAGVHGLQRRDAHGRLRQHTAPDAGLAAVRDELAAFTARHAGLLLEDKKWGVALHYRKRPELEPVVLEFCDELAGRLPDRLGLLRGRMVVEVKPAGMDKGEAIRAFMREAPFAGREAVFVGDDVTDEAGFAVVNALGGVSVKVSCGETAARWRLSGVDAVLAWLERSIGAAAPAEQPAQ